MFRYAYILLIFVALTIASCAKQEPRSTIELSSTRIDARFTCDTIVRIEVKTEVAWVATCEAPWVELQPSDNYKVLKFKLKDNLSTATRQTYINLTSDNAVGSILIIQNGTGSLPLDRIRDSLALVSIYKECGGEQWEFWVENKPVDSWDFQSVFSSWRGVNTASVGGVVRVTALDLSGVGLRGSLPAQIYSLTQLQVLTVQNNMIEESPLEVLSRLPNLTFVNLSYNPFKLTIPLEVVSLSHLNYLYLNGVDCSEVEASRFAQFRELRLLEMAGANVSGAFPEFLRSLTKLEQLNLSYNALGGMLPDWIGELSELEVLDLCGCQMSGALPPSITSLGKLEVLKLAQNSFSGDIPASIGSLKYLRTLNLSECDFVSLPNSLTLCREMEYLDLSFNDIGGSPFLDEFARLPRLEFCSLLGNRFVGSISAEVLSSARWKSWFGEQLICPQQQGYGFENCK